MSNQNCVPFNDLCVLWSVVTDGSVTGEIAYGDHTFFYVDVNTTSRVLVELHKEEHLAFPMLFVSKGTVPSPIHHTYSHVIKEVQINLLANSTGLSHGERGMAKNVRINLTGLVPPGAYVVGVWYEALEVRAEEPSFVEEACFAFAGSNGYQDMFCPSDLDAPGAQELSGQSDVKFQVEEDGMLMLELFESISDHGSNDSADAYWNGTLELQYVERTGTGFDYQDAESIWCTVEDCAVDYDHKILLPATPGRYFIGVFNAKHIESEIIQNADHGSARYNSDMTFSLRIHVGANETHIPCYTDPTKEALCNGHGACGKRAPVCDCEDGWFGRACEIRPTELKVQRRAATKAVPWTPWTLPGTAMVSVSATLVEGRFDYYKLNIPRGAKSLVVTMKTSPVSDSSPHMFLRAGGLPEYCHSILGRGQDGWFGRACEHNFDMKGACLSFHVV